MIVSKQMLPLIHPDGESQKKFGTSSLGGVLFTSALHGRSRVGLIQDLLDLRLEAHVLVSGHQNPGQRTRAGLSSFAKGNKRLTYEVVGGVVFLPPAFSVTFLLIEGSILPTSESSASMRSASSMIVNRTWSKPWGLHMLR